MSTIYDKADYHLGGSFPRNLSEVHAYIHTGMYLGWIIDNNLVSEFFEEESSEDIKKFKQRKMTGTQIYQKWDGVLDSDMLNDEGNKFSQYYFDFDKGNFANDYEKLLCTDYPTIFHPNDTWENYYKLKEIIDERYESWKE